MMAGGVKAVDLFAGVGGFSEGAKRADVKVVWAADHWAAAVEAHAANHPDTIHATQDLHQADWTQVPAFDLLLASPACQGHSRARARGKPHHDASRSTAWAVVSALECHRPRLGGVVENVVEFLKWELYPAWEHAIRALGYRLAPHIVNAADHGVPQDRKRIFIVLTPSRQALYLNLPRRAHVAASEIIDWNAGNWSPIDRPGRSANTLRRIESGREKFGDRFLIAYYGRTFGGRSLNRPIGTLTTRDRYALVDGDRMRMLHWTESRRGMGFGDDYWLPDDQKLATHLCGNAVCPQVAADVITTLIASA